VLGGQVDDPHDNGAGRDGIRDRLDVALVAASPISRDFISTDRKLAITRSRVPMLRVPTASRSRCR